MKKKILLVASLLAVLCLLSSCMMVPASVLESMFGSGTGSGYTAPEKPAVTGGSDQVTVSRSEYERLLRFSELADLYDMAQ